MIFITLDQGMAQETLRYELTWFTNNRRKEGSSTKNEHTMMK